MKHKPADKANAAAAIKKPRHSEVNYCPPHPTGESDESLENLRVALLSEVKKNNNREVIRMKMEKTFSHRRYEVVRDTPMVQDFKARWPALFDVSEVCHELILVGWGADGWEPLLYNKVAFVNINVLKV